MDFGLDALAVATTAAATNTPTPPAAVAGDGDARPFAAHLSDPDEDVVLDAAEPSDTGRDADIADTAAAPTIVSLEPAQILLQLLGVAPSTVASSEDAAAETAPPPQTLPTSGDTAKAAPPLNESAPLSAPAPIAPVATPEAETAAALPNDVAPPPAPSPPTQPTDALAPANVASPPPLPTGIAKPTAKSLPSLKSNSSEATTQPVVATEPLEADHDTLSQQSLEIAPSRDVRGNAPDNRSAHAEPAFALANDGAAAPTPAPQSSSPLPGVISANVAGVGDSAPITQARSADAAPAATQVAQEIVRRFDGDTTHFEVRLDPPELGRVEVRLEVTRDNKVSASVMADSPQTLVELARHARELQNSLQAAGLDLADHGLSFDLRDGGREARDARSDSSRLPASGSNGAPEDLAPRTRASGLDPWRGRTLDMTA